MNVHLTQHAIARYQERVRPGLDFAAAKIELRLLIDCHGERRDPPGALEVKPADAWVSIGDDVWIPCSIDADRLVARSVMCRGHEREGAGSSRRRAKRMNRWAARHEDFQDAPSATSRGPRTRTAAP